MVRIRIYFIKPTTYGLALARPSECIIRANNALATVVIFSRHRLGLVLRLVAM